MNCKDIFDYHGWREQCKKITEEIYELVECIHDYECLSGDGSIEANYKQMIEEIADVELLLDEIKQKYMINKEEVSYWKSYKFKREIKRIKDGYYSRKQNTKTSNKVS